MSSKGPLHQFGINFSAVRDIPEDPKVRLDYFRRFKALIAGEHEKIQTWHRSGAGGREVIQALTGLNDEVIRHVVNALAALPAYRSKKILDKFALIAVGGYGRGELNPSSDIDLLFLLKRQMDSTLDRFIQDIISVLWGIGMEIGQSCRTVKECQLLAREDFTILTSMIEIRYITGLRDLSEKLADSVRKNILKKKSKEFLDDHLRQFHSRAESRQGVTGDPEPDIKNGPGGLRDYHAALWAVAVTFNGASLQEIHRDDVITPRELAQLDESVGYLLRTRTDLHYLKDKKSDVLELGLQKDLAASLGYRTESGTGDVESFMHDYFQHATNIRHLSDVIFHRCLEVNPTLKNLLSHLKKKNLENGFAINKSRLSVQEYDEGLFEKEPFLLITVFELCARHGLEPDPQLKRLIRQSVHLADQEFIDDTRVGEFLSKLLNEPHSERILRLLHDSGLLAHLIPEFGKTLFRVRYDFYHRYTADEHALRMVHFLETLPEQSDEGLHKFKELYEGTQDRLVLKLACLLHSLGKEAGAASSQQTREMLCRIFERLWLAPDQRQTLFFLIDQLAIMSEIAFHEDIHDPATIRKMGQLADTPERLDLMLLMSYAELNAIAPGTWTAWKRLLLSELYHRTHNYLVRPQSLADKPIITRAAVYSMMGDLIPKEEIDRHLDSMPDDYLLAAESKDIVEHLRLIKKRGGQPFSIQFNNHEAEGFFDLMLCGQSNIGMFKNLVGTLTTRALNILGAQIFTSRDGVALLTLQVAGENALQIFGSLDKVWQEIEKNLNDLMNETKTLQDLLKERTRLLRPVKNDTPIEPRIHIENYSENPYTLVRIEARDHPGMLYKIAHGFREFGIRMHRAKIATRGGKGIDVFSISLNGKRITFPALIQRLKDRLITLLLVEKLEDLG